MLGEKNE